MPGARRAPYGSTALATAVALTILGTLALVAAQAERIGRELRESLTVVAELHPGTTPEERRGLEQWLASRNLANPGSVAYVSAAEGAARLRAAYGDDLLTAGLDNPLLDLYTFTLPAARAEGESRGRVRASVAAREEVAAAYVQDDAVARAIARLGRLGYGALALAIALLAGTGYLVVNTARLALLSKANVIRNMELVGASWGFIARPFLWRSAAVGVIAGLLSIVLCYGLHEALLSLLPGLWAPLSPPWLLTGAAGLVGLAAGLNVGTTFAVIRTTLQLRVDDLD